jgi:hypothetical protein
MQMAIEHQWWQKYANYLYRIKQVLVELHGRSTMNNDRAAAANKITLILVHTQSLL